MARVRLGVIPAMGSGLESMAATGQFERLFMHLRLYAAEFDVTYFTWGDWAEEERLWRPFQEDTGAHLVSLRGWGWSRALRACDVLRSMNLLGTIPALFARWRWGIPFVMSYGAHYARIAALHGRPTWKWTALTHVALRWAQRVLVSNAALAQRLRAMVPSAAITEHPNWVDGQRFAPDGRTRPGTPRTVLYVGRLVKEKNLPALAAAVGAVPETRLICVGAGPEESALRRLTVVTCVGVQPWTHLPGWYHQADVFALPSHTEGHPKALTEAMACGLPCLVSPAVDAGEQAVWRTGDYAGGLRALFDPDRARRFGAFARAYALAHWDVHRLMPRELGYLHAAAG